MTTTKVQDIAVVSFAPFLNGDVEAQKAVSEKIRNAFSEIGFLYLIDHGIPEELLNEVYSAVSCWPLYLRLVNMIER